MYLGLLTPTPRARFTLIAVVRSQELAFSPIFEQCVYYCNTICLQNTSALVNNCVPSHIFKKTFSSSLPPTYLFLLPYFCCRQLKLKRSSKPIICTVFALIKQKIDPSKRFICHRIQQQRTFFLAHISHRISLPSHSVLLIFQPINVYKWYG